MTNKPILKALKKKNYSQIAYDSLLEYINDYLQRADEDDDLKLPAEVSLAEMMSISRATLRQVLTELETEGRILRIHGKGTFINRNYKEVTPFLDCNELIRHQGYVPSHKVLGIEKTKAPTSVTSKLQCGEDDELWKMDTLYYADQNPCIVLRDWILPGSDREKLDLFMMETTFFEFLTDLTGKHGSYEHSDVYADESGIIKKQFGEQFFSAKAVIVHEAVLYDDDNAPICVTLGYFNPDYIHFHFYGKINAE